MAEKVSVVIEVDSSGAVSAFKSAGSAADAFGASAKAAGAATIGVTSGMGAMSARASEASGIFGRLEQALGMSEGSLKKYVAGLGVAALAFKTAQAALGSFMDVVNRAGELADLSQKIGVAGETLSRFKLSAEASGTSIEGLAVGFKFLSKNLVEASAGGNEAAQGLAAGLKILGVDAKTAVNDTNGALLTLADSFSKMPDGAEKTAVAMKVFGKAGADLIPFLNQGSDSIREMMELNDALGLSMSGATLSALDNFGDNLAMLGQVGRGVFTQLAAGAAPVLESLTSKLLEVAKNAGIGSGRLQEWGKTLAQSVLRAIGSTLNGLANLFEALNDQGPWNVFIGAAKGAFDGLVNLAMVAGKRVVSSLLSSLADGFREMSGISSLFAGGIADGLSSAADKATSEAEALASNVSGALNSPALASAVDNLRAAGKAANDAAAAADNAAGSLGNTGEAVGKVGEGAGKAAQGANTAGAALGAMAGQSDEAKKAADEAAAAAEKYGDALTALGVDASKADRITGIWKMVTEGALSYEAALRNVEAVGAAGEYWEDTAALMDGYAKSLAEATTATMRQAAELVNSNGELAAQAEALTSAAAAGLDYEAAQRAAAEAVVNYQAQQKILGGESAQAVETWRNLQLAALGAAEGFKKADQAAKDASEIGDLTKQLEVWKKVRAGVMSVEEAQRELAIAAKVAAGSSEEAATEMVDLQTKVAETAEAAQNSFINLGEILTGAFDQSFDAIISGTRDLGGALEGIGLSIGKQLFSAMLKSKLGFDLKVQSNFLSLGNFGEGVFSKMFSSVADIGKSIFSGIGDAGGGFFSSIGGLFGGNTGGTTVSPDTGGGGLGGFMKMLGSGFSGLGSTVLKGLTGLGSTIGGFLGFGGGAAAAGTQAMTMASAAVGNPASIAALGAGATGAASGLSAVAAAVSAVLPVIAALGVAIMLLLPAIKKWLDTTTEGTKVRMEGEGILNTSRTFGEDSDLQNRLGPFTRGYDNTRNMEGGGGYSAQGPVYQVGRERASERFVAGGMSEEDARRASDAIAGGGTALFTKLFSKGKSDSQMVNGAKDLGNMMAEFLSRGLAEGMTYEDMIASMREFADEAGVTFEVAIESVAKFGDAASGVWQDGITGPTEFARSMYGVIEIFKSDFPAGVNIGQAALEAMSADGVSAFANLDGATRDWLNQVGQSPEALQAALATLNAQGFNIDTEAFMNALEDLSRSAQAVAPGIAQIFTGAPVMSAIKTMTDTVKNDVMAAFQEVGTQDLFDSTRITQSFQPVYALIRQLKDGAFDISSEGGMDSFMQQLVTATAEGKANLDQYIPQMKAMKAAAEEVQKALDEAFKPTAAEALAAATEAMAANLKQSFGTGLGAALDAALADGGTRGDGIKAFSDSMRTSVKDSIKESIVQGMVEAAVLKGPLAEMMATFGQAFQGAIKDGITGEEQAYLTAFLGQVGDMTDKTIAFLEPSVAAVLDLGKAAESTFGVMDKTVGAPTDPLAKQTAVENKTIADAFGSSAGEAITSVLSGGSVTAAVASFSAGFKASVTQSVGTGLQEALIKAATTEGALGGLMAQFKEQTSAAMADGVLTMQEQASLKGLAGEIKATADATASALEPIVGAVADIGSGLVTKADEAAARLQEAQATLQEGFGSAVDAAFKAIGEGKSVEEATAAFAESFKTSISQSVAQGLQEALVQSAVMEGALGGLMANFKTMTAEAMADGVLTGAEQANLAALATQIKTTGEAAANALAPVVATVAQISTGVAGQSGQVQFDVGSQAQGYVMEANATIGTAAKSATETVASASSTAASTVADATTSASASVAGAVDTAGAAITSAMDSTSAAMSQTGEASAQAVSDVQQELGNATAAAGQAMASAGAAAGTMQQAAAAMAGAVEAAGQGVATDVLAATDSVKASLEALLGTGTDIENMAPDAAYGIGQSLAAVRDKVAPEMQSQIDSLIGSLADASISPEESEKLRSVFGSLGDLSPDLAGNLTTSLNSLATAAAPDLAAKAAEAINSFGSIGEIDPAQFQQTKDALSSIAGVGAGIDAAGVEQFSAVTAALAEGSAALGDPGAVVDTMKALGEAALSSGDATNLAGTMKALGAAALDAGTAADMGATIKAFAAASAEGASNTSAIIDAFSAIDAGTSGKVQESLTALVSNGVAAGAAALSETLGGEGPNAIVSGLATLQAQLDAGTLSSLTDPLNDALGSVVSPADSIRSALDRLKDPTREVTGDMGSLGNAVRSVVSAINSAASDIRSGSPVPGAATGGAFSSGSAVVGEAGKPELVTARDGGGFTVTPLSWSAADSLMKGGTPGLAMGGIVGGGTGGIGGGGGGLPAPPPRGGGYSPDAEGAEFADFTSAIVEAFRAGFEGSKGFIEDFSDSIEESVRTRLVDAIMQGFAEGPAIQGYANAIDGLITKAQTLAGNNKLTAEELANIQAEIKQNTDAIGAQADVLDDLLEPLRQAEAISTAIADGLDFSGALKSLALNPDDLEGFRRSIDQTVNDAVLNGAIQGLLASGPIQDAITSFGDTMNEAMATALEDGVLTAEESGALHDLAVNGSAEMKTAMEALGPVLSALGIDLGDSMSESINRAKEMMKSASGAMDPFASLGEGETQFGNFTQNIRNQVYGNIRDGLVQAFIDSAVTQGLLAGPMAAIQGIFDQIGSKQMTVAEANAAIAQQVAVINGSLNDPAFKAAFDSTMAAINNIGGQLGQTTQRVESAVTTATQAVDTTKDVCKTGCELQARTRSLGDTAVNNFGRAAGISIEDFVPKMALGGLVKKPTIAMVGEAGPELVIPTAELAAAASAIERVNFDAARNSATEGIEALLGSMPAMFTDAISSQMGADDQAAMAQKLKEAAAGMSAGPSAIDPSAIAAAIAAVPSSAAGMSGAGAPSPAIDEMAEKLAAQSKATGEDTVTAIEDLRDAMDDIARALADQPAQTDIKIDGEVLVRAMSKARRLARKAGVEV